MSRVLVLMATRNGAAHLPAQLDSLLGQSHRDWELWVSDDGSTDDTRAIVGAFADRVAQPVHLVDGPQRGVAANFLSLLCRPDLPLEARTHVAFSDQDDVWYPGKLARALDALQGVGGPAIYGAGYDLIDAEGAHLGRSPDLPPDGLRATDPFAWTTAGGLTAMLSPGAVALARRAGVVDVAYHDWWLSLLVAASGGQQIVEGAAVLGYRQHDANQIGASGRSGAAWSRIRAVLDGTYGGWMRANARALLAAPVDLTPQARALAGALARPASPWTRLATLRRHRLRRRDAAGTIALHLAALAGWL